MKRSNVQFRFHILAFLCVAFGAATAHAAATTTHFSLRDRVLIANFESHTAISDDCLLNTVTFIEYSESVTYLTGAPISAQPTTQVEVDYSNSCTGEFYSLFGGTTTQTVSIAGDLAGPTLSAVVPVTDGTNSTTVTLNVTWTANGDIQAGKGHFRFDGGNYKSIDTFDVKLRPADMSGSVTASLPFAAGPIDTVLSQVQDGGTIGNQMVGERTVMIKN